MHTAQQGTALVALAFLLIWALQTVNSLHFKNVPCMHLLLLVLHLPMW